MNLGKTRWLDVIPTVLRAIENNEVQRNRGLMGTKYCDKPR